MAIEFNPPHDDLVFMTPLSDDRAAQLVAFASDGLRGTVVDIGCGWGELLLRVVANAPSASGVGIDIDTTSISHGRDLAKTRELASRVTFVEGDAHGNLPAHADAVICIGASQALAPAMDENQPLDYRSALRAIREHVSPGAHVVYGDAIWSTKPTAEAARPLSGRLDEFVTLDELVAIASDEGFTPAQVHEATLDEWDEFESGYSACYATWLATHPADHEDAPRVRELAQQQHDAYYDGYRGILGLAYLALVADSRTSV